MNFDLDVTVSAITVFVQGILSFFSPCILPIIPLYMGYLSGGSYEVDENGKQVFNQKKVILNTLFFIIGVSFAFLLLGVSFSAFGQFFTNYQDIFTSIGGVFILFIGLYQLGVIDLPFKNKELKLPIKINVKHMSPITALLMGFTFSFAWTPCVGPALSTVLIMISSSDTTAQGLMLMGIYTIGFTLPFLLVGIFTTKCLEIFKKHANIVKYTVKIGAVIMIIIGILMLTGMLTQVSDYLSEDVTTQEQEDEDTAIWQALDFELVDQYGQVHTLDEYEGKVIFLNIWGTWCSPCKAERPYIQQLYEYYGENEGDVIILSVTFPTDYNHYTQEGTISEITGFINENSYTYPTLFDMDARLLIGYGIMSFPTTYTIDTDGNIYGYITGSLSYETMVSMVEQTIEGS